MQDLCGCVQSIKVPTGVEKIRFIIYKATNQVNGKIYIGQTMGEFKRRKADHIKKAKAGCTYCFHNAIRKYGADVFVWEVICLCSSKGEADARESEFIKTFNAKVPSGYNMTDGGEGTLGFCPSEETRARISKAQKLFIQITGKVPFRGMRHTPEARAKITAAQAGRKRGPLSDAHKEKIRNALRGRTIPEEQKIKISKALKGIIVSTEAKINISKAHMGLKYSASARENMKKAWEVRKQKSSTGHGYLKNGHPDYRGRVQL